MNNFERIFTEKQVMDLLERQLDNSNRQIKQIAKKQYNLGVAVGLICGVSLTFAVANVVVDRYNKKKVKELENAVE